MRVVGATLAAAPAAARLLALLLLWAAVQCHSPPAGEGQQLPPPALQPVPANITVLALRPYNLTGLANKDSANVNGEALFYLTAKLMLPVQCRANPDYFECHDTFLTHNEVYTMYEVQTAAATGGGSAFATYAECNPNMSVLPWGAPAAWQCTTLGKPTTDARTGMTNMCGDDCVKTEQKDSPLVVNWTCAVSKLLGATNATLSHSAPTMRSGDGERVRAPAAAADAVTGSCAMQWYSHPAPSNCDAFPGRNCTWRVTRTVKIVNASCVHQHLFDFVTAQDPSCFQGCPDPTNRTTDCWVQCFFNVAVANSTAGSPGLSAAELLRPWVAAFASEDPAVMGCPGLPPYSPSPPLQRPAVVDDDSVRRFPASRRGSA